MEYGHLKENCILEWNMATLRKTAKLEWNMATLRKAAYWNGIWPP